MAEKFVDIFFDIITALLSLLPSSPFIGMAATIPDFDFLPYLNYFIPFDNAFVMMTTWLVCCALYYIYKYSKQIIDFIKSML